MEFEALLKQHMGVLERFVKYKIGNPADGEDVLQEVCSHAGYASIDLSQHNTNGTPWTSSPTNPN